MKIITLYSSKVAENKKIHLEKGKVNVDSLKENHREFRKTNELISKSQQKIKSKKRNIFTKEINKIALSANDDERMQWIDSKETNAWETSENLICKKKKNKCNKIIKKIINFDDVTKENIK